MVQFIYTFYSKKITLEQFIMKLFYHNRDKAKLASVGIEFFQGQNVMQKDIMGNNGLL